MTTPSATTDELASAASGRREELLLLSDLSLAEYLRHNARYGGAILEQDGLLLFAGAHPQPNPYRNGALVLGGGLAVKDVLERAEDFFVRLLGRRTGYALWVRGHADAELEAMATEAQLPELERLPELVLDELPPEVPPPDGVEIRPALDEQTRNDYLQVVADAWGMGSMPLDMAARVFFDPQSVDVPNVSAFVAYYDDLPLSGAMTFVTHQVALGCQAATIRRPKRGQRLPPPGPPEQRRGLAESCLWAALKVSFEELGARWSLCQTSSLGEPAWRQLGYQPLTSYARYLVSTRPASG
jgi:hypothetical protein